MLVFRKLNDPKISYKMMETVKINGSFDIKWVTFLKSVERLFLSLEFHFVQLVIFSFFFYQKSQYVRILVVLLHIKTFKIFTA